MKFRYLCLLLLLLAPGVLFGAPQKPRRAAFLQSLVVPGWGQYSLGKKNSALTFFGAELLLIGGMYTLRSYGELAREDYQAMAATYAGVVGEHDHDFYVDVGNWMNVTEFNEQRMRSREFDQMYVRPIDRWQWDTDEHRGEMEAKRIKSDRAFNSVIYLIGGLAVNHITSAIHAGRTAARQARDQSELAPTKWQVAVGPVNHDGGFRLRLVRQF